MGSLQKGNTSNNKMEWKSKDFITKRQIDDQDHHLNQITVAHSLARSNKIGIKIISQKWVNVPSVDYLDLKGEQIGNFYNKGNEKTN